MLVSIVVPCYNEENTIGAFVDALDEVVKDRETWTGDESGSVDTPEFELILVNDGSTDSTLVKIKDLAESCPVGRCRWISFSRNFGKEAAMLAGLQASQGDLVAIMDADLQDPPTLLPEMYARITSGECSVVATKRSNRAGEPLMRSFFARQFYKLINKISDVEIVDGARDFRLMSRQVVDAVLELSERNRFSKGLFSWVGFKTEWISYPNIERSSDKSSWNFSSLMRYAMNGITAFSSAPLIFASGTGLVLCLIALIAVVFIVIRAILIGDPVSGWPSLACIVIFLGGMQLFFLGVVGQYLAKVYDETKQRPHYIISESNLPVEEPKAESD